MKVAVRACARVSPQRPRTFIAEAGAAQSMQSNGLLGDVARRLALPENEAEGIARVVLVGLHIQLPEEAAKELERTMPSEAKRLWEHPGEDLKLARGSSTSFARHQYIKYVADHTHLDPPQAEEAIRSVFAALRKLVPAADAIVKEELSEGIRELWVPALDRRREAVPGR